MPYYARLTVFITLTILCVLLLISLFLYRPLKGIIIKRNVTEFYYHRVMRTARLRDYYLVNDIHLKLGGKDYVSINHVLGGDKYIYVILDEYYEGAISAKRDDVHWVRYPKKNVKESIPNPLILSKEAVDRFSKASGINASFLVGIVLVNDDCFITPLELRKGEPALVPLSRLDKVVQIYEKEDVEPLAQEALRKAMVSLHNTKAVDQNE